MGGKWLELLKEVAPAVKHAAIMFNPDTAPGGGGFFLHSFEAAGAVLGVKPIVAPVRSPSEIEKVIGDLAREPDGGLVLMSDIFLQLNRKQVMTLAERHKLPVIYWLGAFAKEGGLLGYGPDYYDLFRRSASYVDRILKGEKPSICRCRCRPNSSWSSTSRPRKQSASPCRRCCSPAPTRSSNSRD